MDDDYLEIVSDAVDCWNIREGELRLSNEEIRRFDVLNEKLVDDFPKTPIEMSVSRRRLKSSIKKLIKDIALEPDPVEEFEKRYGSIIGGFMSPPSGKYSVGFPLNINYGPDKLKFDGITIDKMERRKWIKKYKESAEGTEEFDEFMNETPNSFKSRYTYWESNIEANDIQFVADRIDDVLQLILGEIIYCLQSWTQKTFRTSSRLTPYAWSELKHPFVYIVLRNGSYEMVLYDEDAGRRVRQSAPFGEDKLKEYYKRIPEFTDPNEIEQKIINSFRNFHRGATEHRNQQSFFHMWRALENLSLTEDGDPSRMVLDRASSVINTELLSDEYGLSADSVSFEDRINNLKNKRNNLVHEGISVVITERDLEFLRAIWFKLIPFMIINRKWTEENIRFWMDNSSKELDSLKKSIDDRQENIDRTKEERDILKKIVSSQQSY